MLMASEEWPTVRYSSRPLLNWTGNCAFLSGREGGSQWQKGSPRVVVYLRLPWRYLQGAPVECHCLYAVPQLRRYQGHVIEGFHIAGSEGESCAEVSCCLRPPPERVQSRSQIIVHLGIFRLDAATCVSPGRRTLNPREIADRQSSLVMGAVQGSPPAAPAFSYTYSFRRDRGLNFPAPGGDIIILDILFVQYAGGALCRQ